MNNRERTLNRTERLFSLILLLQNRPSLTSRDLAEHVGVSRRTIFRDLRALSESGVPLTYAEKGGYEILEGYQLPPLMLSARQAATRRRRCRDSTRPLHRICPTPIARSFSRRRSMTTSPTTAPTQSSQLRWPPT